MNPILTAAATLALILFSNCRLASSRSLDAEQKVGHGHGCLDSSAELPIVVQLNIFVRVTPRQCTGSIISPNLVLTAAHCIDGIPKLVTGNRRNGYSISAVAGEYGSQNDDVQIRKVVEFVRHEHYNRATRQNDFAILILAAPLSSGSFRVVELPKPEQSFNGTAHICGWGALAEDEETPEFRNQELRNAVVSLRNGFACANAFQNTPLWYDDEISICAGGSEHDTCHGTGVGDSADSGGPLICTSNSKQYLCGVKSWASECGRRAPVVYTRVSSFTEWIQSKIDLYSGTAGGSPSNGEPKSRIETVPLVPQLTQVESMTSEAIETITFPVTPTETPVSISRREINRDAEREREQNLRSPAAWAMKLVSMLITILGGHGPDFHRAEAPST